MAHDQPNHLANLVRSLQADWMSIFVHIDKRADLSEFLDIIPADQKVTFLGSSQRVSVFRSGYSHITATLNLLKASREGSEHFDRFCLVSGSGFPIKNLNEIRTILMSEKEFIRIDDRIDNSVHNFYGRNVKYRYFLESGLPSATRMVLRLPRRVYKKIPLYKGSAFWALTSGCVNYVLDFLEQNKDYSDFHRYTLCPEEILFHSIVKCSPFAKNITHDFENALNQADFRAMNVHGCHYIDWNSTGVRLPRVLVEKDLETLLKSKALFARKFREGESGQLVNMIQKALANS
jgi:hypothetical protein